MILYERFVGLFANARTVKGQQFFMSGRRHVVGAEHTVAAEQFNNSPCIPIHHRMTVACGEFADFVFGFDPRKPFFVNYTNTGAALNDIAPEGIEFIPADKSPNGKPLLVVGFEFSGSTRIFELTE